MNIVKEFKEFAIKGNVIDLAVGVIIGSAFGKIVDSLVKDVIMPPIGMIISKVDFAKLRYLLQEEEREGGKVIAPEVAVNYGNFINQVIHFLIVALAVFLLVKQINRLKRNSQKLPPTMRECPWCVSSISVKATRCPNCTSELESAMNDENLRELNS